MRLLRNILFSTVFVAIASNFVIARTIEAREQPIIELQNSAKELSKQWKSEAIRQSIALFLSAAEKWKNIGKPEKASNCLQESAQLYLLLGENDSALLKLLESLKLTVFNNLLVEKAKTQSLLSIVYRRLGKKGESKTYMKTSLKESYFSKDVSAMAMADFSAAEYYYIWNEFEKAIDYYQKSFDRWQEIGNSHGQAEVLIYYAYVYMVLGEPAQGLIKAKEAERISKEINEPRSIKLSQIAIGHLLSVMDNKQSALEYYLEANKDFPDDLDSIEKAALFNGIGMIYEDYGDFSMSLNYREKALALFQGEKYFYGQLSTMHSLIKLNYLLQNPQKAEFYYEETKKLSAQLNDNYFLAIVYRQIGDFYFEHFSYTVALDYYQKSLKTSQLTGYKTNDSLVLDRLGMIYQRRNQFDIARTNYNSSLEISRKILNRFNESQTLYNLALLDNLEYKYESSLQQIKQSIEITELLTANVLNTKLRSTYFSNVVDRYELYINLLMKLHKQSPTENYAVEALQAAEKSRARVMLENLSLSEANFTKDADAETVTREKEIRVLLNAKADKLTDLLSQNADKAETENISNEINELEHKLEEIKANLKQSSPLYSAIKNPAPFDVAEFQKKILDENTLLLEFSFGDEESYLWLIGKNEVSSYVLPPREQIEAKIQKLRELLASRERRKDEEIEAFQARIVEADNAYWQVAGQLSSELFGQVSDKFGKNRLIIVPDGKLNYFPVSALPLPNSESNEPILLSNEVIYEPSASTLSLLSKSPNQSDVAPKNLLVFSDPVFTKDDSRISAENKAEENSKTESVSLESFRFVESLNSLARLMASKDEADSIIDILGTSNADAFSGYSASREQLLNAKTADYKIIHFATHGLINEERPELSGIVLSRFDENGQKLNEFVRLQDIYGLNLNSDLVVLSACSTGIGKEVRGEGLMSLNNAFLQVGAKTVMSSLWKVEDNATLELMKNFYQTLSDEKVTPSKALQEAQIKMWQSGRYKSPFYWAAFTVQGDYKRAPNLSKDFPYTIFLSVIGLALLAFGIFWLYRFRRGKPLLLNRK